jgi:hypothetical protein
MFLFLGILSDFQGLLTESQLNQLKTKNRSSDDTKNKPKRELASFLDSLTKLKNTHGLIVYPS